MTRIRHLPKNDRILGWSNILPPLRPEPALQGETHADLVVIGAGFAGLGAARRLAEIDPRLNVVLLEADLCGENASVRSSGFAIDLPHNVGSSMEELAKGRAYMRLARGGIAALQDSVMRQGIRCDGSLDGKYHTASSDRGRAGVLVPTTQEPDRLEAPYRWLDRAECEARLDTAHFAAAVHTPGSVLLNPAALVRGLADTLPASVRLF